MTKLQKTMDSCHPASSSYPWNRTAAIWLLPIWVDDARDIGQLSMKCIGDPQANFGQEGIDHCGYTHIKQESNSDCWQVKKPSFFMAAALGVQRAQWAFQVYLSTPAGAVGGTPTSQCAKRNYFMASLWMVDHGGPMPMAPGVSAQGDSGTSQRVGLKFFSVDLLNKNQRVWRKSSGEPELEHIGL